MKRTALYLLGMFITGSPAWGADVLCQHNDLARTGANLEESQLTPASVKKGFGKLGFHTVDGQIYAQPLVVSGVKIPGKTATNLVLVATMKNNVYAFDAEDARDDTPLWKVNLGNPVPYKMIPFNWGALLGQYNIWPFIGITSTPVIDSVTGRMWVSAKTRQSGDDLRYRLHCLDIKTGTVLASSQPIEEGTGEDKLQAQTALQRPGLALANGMVYLCFGSHQDGGYYHGWVLAFDATTLQKKYSFCTTPGDKSGEGGVWQAGNGPALDPQGNLYLMTGNGAFDPDHQYGTSFVKLSPQLNALSWFTPNNYEKLTRDDIDLGSSGPMLLPNANQLVGGGKQGRFYLLDANQLGKLQPKHSVAPALQVFKATDHWTLTWMSWLIPVFGYHHIHGGPVYWMSDAKGPLVYVWPEETHLEAFAYDPRTHFRTKPVVRGPRAPKGMPGGCLSLSANQGRDGLIWASTPKDEDAFVKVVPGTLRVFDAETLQLLWSTDQEIPPDKFDFAKYCAPTVANGKVYLATFSNTLNVYGLSAPEEPLPDWTQKGKPIRKSHGHGRMNM